MKKWVVIIIASLFTNILSQTIVSPQFSELKGMEDQLGNTHLFYRIFTSYINEPFYNDMTNNIYRFDLSTLTDSLFLPDYSHSNLYNSYFMIVKDYAFWDDDFTKYIFCGSKGASEPEAYIKRFDSDYIVLNYLCCEVNQIDISSSDDSLIYSGGWLDNGSSLRSADGGFNWATINESLKFISLNPFNDNILFAFDNSDDLLRSSDGGNSFHSVDTTGNYNWEKFIYDIDEEHIYRTTFKYPFHYLIISNNKGEAFSWQTKYSSDSEIFISVDETTSGTIYLADKKNILVSTDYGNSFSLYKTLERKIVGIYKKPNSNKLYAATKYKIYEITPDTAQVIKSLPIPEDAFSWLPLNLGDRWIYLNTFYGDLGDSSRWISIKEVVGYKTVENQVYNELLVTEFPIDTIGLTVTHPQFFRVDSSSGLIYQAWIENDSLLLEELYMDLLVEVGDTIPVGNGIYLASDEPFTIFGLNSRKRTFFSTQTPYEDIKLVQSLGLTFKLVWELVEIKNVLKGCIIDGLVYGDTTTVGVEDEDPPIATNFKLEQNYPNPFNPRTVISYQLPVSSSVTLKVYDILGNEVATLVNEYKPAGEYEVEFTAVSHSGNIRNLPAGRQGLTSGIYFYQLKAGSFNQTKKMILLK